ncbi:MAG: agmatinase [Eudoraea sp.]|uniref:agmatinase n=1 Tax=Eudoraea sp. TaxID=1979955 RepID=UPI003C77214D
MKTKTYAGIPAEFAQLEKSKITIIPVPYDGTSTWGKGADKGPQAFLEASDNMELYDIETDTEVYKQGIYLAPELEDLSSPEAMVNEVHRVTKEFIKRNKFVTLFGGEHSISIGSIRAFNECYENLSVLHIDAHADLRKTYDGTPFNHACAVHEASQQTNLVQVGIRSMDTLEKTYMDLDKTFFAQDLTENEYWIDNVLDLLTDNVFISFDLDALDPSIMPSTGTPEPGGLLWYETLEFLSEVFKEKNVVGFDMVELCPNPAEKSSDFLAAKLFYKMLSYKFKGEEAEDAYDNSYEMDSKETQNSPLKFQDDDE